MTRIVAGRFGGRILATPAGTTTRPTGEKVRAALGNALSAGGGLDGARVLDLYAGSGALGLELLSRGAASVVLVEQDKAALTAIRTNIAALGASAEVIAGDVRQVASRQFAAPFDIVLADPPYHLAADELVAVFAALHAAGSLSPGADLIVERDVRSGELPWPEPLAAARAKRYGDTLLCYGRAP